MIYWHLRPIVKDEQLTASAVWVDLLHILHTQTTEQYNIESSCIDLNNSVVVGSVSENTKKWEPIAQDLYSYHACGYSWSAYEYKYKYWIVKYEYKYKYSKIVLEYYSRTSTITEYYNSGNNWDIEQYSMLSKPTMPIPLKFEPNYN